MKATISITSLVIASTVFLITLSGCQGGIVGNGKVETQEKKVEEFSRLDISGNFKVYLEPSATPYLKMELDENLYDIVRVSQNGQTLKVETRVTILDAHRKILRVGFTKLEGMDLSGAIKVVSDSVVRTGNLEISVTGAVRLDFDVEARFLRFDLSGASECDLRGRTDGLRVHMAGAGDFNSRDLIAKDVQIDLSGAGTANVYAKDMLEVSISGLGSVRYRGEPEVHKSISGLGSLKKD